MRLLSSSIALALLALLSCAPASHHAAALDVAITRYLEGPLDSATTAFAQVVRTEPGNVDALAWLADARRRSGQPDSAAALARQALARSPGHGFAHFVLGATFDPIKSGWNHAHRDSAVAHYRAAAHATPPEADGWIGLWLYASVAGDTAGVRSALQGMDRTGFLTPAAAAWGSWLLAGLPPGAILLTNGDMDTFPCGIVQVRGVRPDVLIVNLSLLNLGEYARSLQRLHGLPLPPAVVGGGADDTRAVQVDGRTWHVADLVADLWARQARAGALVRPLYAATTVTPTDVLGDAATLRRHLAGPRWHIAPDADSVTDRAALAAAVQAIDPAAFAGHVASTIDRSPVRRRHSDRMVLNVAHVARLHGETCAAAGDRAGLEAALAKVEGLRRSAVLGDSLEHVLRELREGPGPAAH